MRGQDALPFPSFLGVGGQWNDAKFHFSNPSLGIGNILFSIDWLGIFDPTFGAAFILL